MIQKTHIGQNFSKIDNKGGYFLAKYAISEEGIQALEKLSQDLKQASNAIDEESVKLHRIAEGLEDGLGIYYKDILELIRDVVTVNKTSKDEVEYLADKRIPQLKELIFTLMCNGMGDGSSDDEDEPPQKKLVLRRR